MICIEHLRKEYPTAVPLKDVNVEIHKGDVVIRYSGESFDPLQTDNELSLLLAKKATENIIYSFDDKQNLPNRVDSQIH